MNLENFIGFPKKTVIDALTKENIKYEIVDFDTNKKFDTELLVTFHKVNNIYILYFDKFLINI